MKRSELKTNIVYKVRDASNLISGDYAYKGIYNFSSKGIALECIVALMEKHGTKREDYAIIEVRRTESLITF